MPLDTESLLISNISFCNKEAANIRSNDFKQKIIEYLDNKYKIQINNKILNDLLLTNKKVFDKVVSEVK